MACCCSPSTTLNPSVSLLLKNPRTHLSDKFQSWKKPLTKSNKCEKISINGGFRRSPFTSHCTRLSSKVSEAESEYETEEYDSSEEYAKEGDGKPAPPVRRRLRRYRKQHPGEKKGITEEMRFVAMKLRNSGKIKDNSASVGETDEEKVKNYDEKEDNLSEKNNEDKDGQTWQPSIEGFLKYLVDSKLVFSTIERIVDESSDVSYVYFRKSGLERSDCISRDLEWFREQGNVIPEASNPGVEYARYLEELAETSAPLFLCHFYNIYFSHIAGGQVISKKVSKKILEGKELEFQRWEGDAEELLRGVREKLNALSEHWSRDEKTKCLRESTKAFRFLGQIVRLIIL